MLRGHCLCGAVGYETAGTPAMETLCHCTKCRRAAGSPMVGWYTVPRDSYRVVAGEPASYRSSEHATRTFCFQSTRYPDEIDITTCSLDDPEQLPPRDHIRASTRLSWIKLDDGLPIYPEERPRT